MTLRQASNSVTRYYNHGDSVQNNPIPGSASLARHQRLLIIEYVSKGLQAGSLYLVHYYMSENMPASQGGGLWVQLTGHP